LRTRITEWSKKLGQFLTDLTNYFTVWKRKKFAMWFTQYISPHLKYVAALPSKTTDMFQYDANLEENEHA